MSDINIIKNNSSSEEFDFFPQVSEEGIFASTNEEAIFLETIGSSNSDQIEEEKAIPNQKSLSSRKLDFTSGASLQNATTHS